MEFTGPAFRDFVLSELLDDVENDELIDLYFAEKRLQIHFPSHLLWEFYTRTSDVTIPVSKVTYLLESFKSQATAKEQAFLSIVSDGDDKGKEFISTWSLVEIGKSITEKMVSSYMLSGVKDKISLERIL